MQSVERILLLALRELERRGAFAVRRSLVVVVSVRVLAALVLDRRLIHIDDELLQQGAIVGIAASVLRVPLLQLRVVVERFLRIRALALLLDRFLLVDLHRVVLHARS